MKIRYRETPDSCSSDQVRYSRPHMIGMIWRSWPWLDLEAGSRLIFACWEEIQIKHVPGLPTMFPPTDPSLPGDVENSVVSGFSRHQAAGRPRGMESGIKPQNTWYLEHIPPLRRISLIRRPMSWSKNANPSITTT
jgi:hypothetical protein